MKKTLQALCSVLFLALFNNAIAQNFAVVLEENFDATAIPAGWTQEVSTAPPVGASSTVTSTGWAFGEGPYTSQYWTVPASLDATPFAIANDDVVDQDRSYDLLKSPVMNLTAYDSAIFLYDVFYNGQWGSEAYFMISYDAGTTWLELAINDSAVWAEDGIMLPATITVGGNNYTFNDQMMVGFNHRDAGGWASGFAVDNFIAAGFNNPCDDIVTIPSCGAAQTVTHGGFGVLDWQFTTGCGYTTFGTEQLFSFTPSVSGVHTLDVTATTGNSWFDYMYKPISTGCDTIGWTCLGDVIDPASYGMNLTAGLTYLILVDNEFIDTETQTFEISCPCTYTSLNGTSEGEACGATSNDGCALNPSPTYGSISCGETISGVTWADGGTRDVDYYQFTINSEQNLSFTFGGGLPLNAFLTQGCDGNIVDSVFANAATPACQSNTLSFTAEAGTYSLLILPTAFEAYPCGSPEGIYDVSMTCSCPEVYSAGTATPNAAPCYNGSPVSISATASGNQIIPSGYVLGYALTEGGTVTQVGATSTFTVNAVGTYVIHPFVYDPLELNPAVAIGQPATVVNSLLVQGGGTYCAGLDLTGATVLVETCTTGQIDPCIEAESTYIDLNNAGGAPCDDGNGCVPTDAGFTTFGVYGSEAYLLDGVQAGFDYVFSMCTGIGAGSWIPEITILAADGTTVDAWNGEEATGSNLTFIDNCTIEWTATQSGTYTIIINELGTAAGDAPSQVNCTTTLTVDNGNPIVSCGQNAASCLPCEVGTLTSPAVQSICPGETFDVVLSGNSTPGSYNLYFDNTGTGGTGGIEEPVTITGYGQGDFPLAIDEDINGVLSSNQLPPLAGTWLVKVIVVDNQQLPCDSTDSFTVNFLDANDLQCITVGIDDAEEIGVNIYPNPSNGQFVIEAYGIEAEAEIRVVDLTGRLVYSEAVLMNESFRKELNVNAAEGTYVLQLISEKKSLNRKIQIQR